MTASLLPLVVVGAPAVAVVAILGAPRRPSEGEWWSLLSTVLTLAAVAVTVRGVLQGQVYETPHLAFPPGDLFLRADAAGALFALLSSSLWVATHVYSVGYVRGAGMIRRPRYYAAFAASVSASLGVAFAGNLLTLFVFYELLTVATYPLVVHFGTDEARRAGRTYVLYTLGGGVAVLGGVVLLNAAAGPVGFVPGGVGGLTDQPTVAGAAFALLVAGFGVKAAVLPLHRWLPAAMVAPTPVSGLLHAVAVVKSGVFGIARVVLFVFGPDAVSALGVGLPLAALAAVTMTVAGLVAIRQTSLKRGLAYSTVSQLSYIVLGIAVLTPAAITGALLHLAAHGFMKITLFFCAGVVYVETGVEDVDDLAGIATRLPLTMTAFAVASAGLVGLPFVAGFVSKWYLLTGMLAPGDLPFAAALLLAGLLKLLFLWPIVASAFFAEDDGAAWRRRAEAFADGGTEGVGHGRGPDATEAGRGRGDGEWPRRAWREEAPWTLLGPVLVVVAVAVVFGTVPELLPFFELARDVAAEVVGP